MSLRVATPSRGRLRDDVADLLVQAGLAGRAGLQADLADVELIEMRPRDAGAWLRAGRLEGAFISTDIVMEEGLGHLQALPLGVARSTLIVAVKDEDARRLPKDLEGATIATHLPRATEAWLAEAGVGAQVVTMGGALEGICAAGVADAIVDLRESGLSLARHGLRVLAELAPCQGLFVYDGSEGLEPLRLRLEAVVEARSRRYVMLHLAKDRLEEISKLFHGLAAPTVLPLAGRTDLVAVHVVLEADQFWSRLAQLRQLGATGIVSLQPEALLV